MQKELIRTIQIIIIAGVLGFIGILYTNNQALDRKRQTISDCFKSAQYTVTDSANNAVSSEPIQRYFKSCMQFNGYNENFTFAE